MTEHFTLEEMIRSNTALRLGLDNTPPADLIPNIRHTAQVLETIRANFARKIRVLSCYRSPEVNRAVGGSPFSAHRFGLAADFIVENTPVIEVCSWIEKNMTGFDQVIYEFGPQGWCHLGLAREGAPARQQALSAVKRGGKTVYLPGIMEAE